MSQSPLSRRHRKISQMISRVCLLDIHSLSVLVSLWQYCALVFFWQLLSSATTHIHLFQEFHHCQHLASLPNLIHLHLFHCRNLTLLWTRGRFHPSSNYLQYRPHVHYRRHLTHLNTPERRCTTIPVVLPWSLCHRTLSKHAAQWDRTTFKDVANSESMVGGNLFTPIRYHCIGFYGAGLLKVSVLLYVPKMIPLYPLNPSQYRDLYVLRRATAKFFPSWLMRSNFVYNSKW